MLIRCKFSWNFVQIKNEIIIKTEIMKLMKNYARQNKHLRKICIVSWRHLSPEEDNPHE